MENLNGHFKQSSFGLLRSFILDLKAHNFDYTIRYTASQKTNPNSPKTVNQVFHSGPTFKCHCFLKPNKKKSGLISSLPHKESPKRLKCGLTLWLCRNNREHL